MYDSKIPPFKQSKTPPKSTITTTNLLIHHALIVNNITNFIKITQDIEKSQYNTWFKLFKIHAQVYEVLDHIIHTPTTEPRYSSPSIKETDPTLWKRLDAIVLQWIYDTVSIDLLHTIIDCDSTAQALGLSFQYLL